MFDASKAFDKVNRKKAIAQLIEEGFDPAIIRILETYYSNHFLIIVNGGIRSDPIKATEGLKQGGNDSPRGYNKYSSPILRKTHDSKLGILLRSMVVSSVGFADDISCIADKVCNAQALTDIVAAEGRKLDIKFNQKKSVVVTNDPNPPSISMDGVIIPVVKETRYLGSQISSEDQNVFHLKTRIKKAKSAAGMLRGVGLLSNNLKPKTKAFLFKVFVRPIFQYGIETCCLTLKQLKLLRKNETMLFKSVIGINKQIRNTELN